MVGKESVSVAGMTIEAFKIQGRGSNKRGDQLEYSYWIAPDRVRRALVQEHVFRNRNGEVIASERTELVSYRQARDPGAARSQ